MTSESIEKITFYSGPMHGQFRDLPEGHGDVFPIKERMRKGGQSGLRDGVYTRVYSSGGVPSHDFEWAGYTSPFIPLRIES